MQHVISSSQRSRSPLTLLVALLMAAGCTDSPVTPGVDQEGEPLLSKTQSERAAEGAPGYGATAVFHQLRPTMFTVQRWDVEVIVTETVGKDAGATLWLRYSVRDEEGLFYTDLWPCEARPCPLDPSSPIAIDSDDLTIHPGLRWATLDTEIPVIDGESNTTGAVHLQVTWEREQSRGPSKPVTASLAIDVTSGSFPLVEDLPPSTLVDAALTRIRP